MKPFAATLRTWNRTTSRYEFTAVLVLEFLMEQGYASHGDYGNTDLSAPEAVAVVRNADGSLGTARVSDLSTNEVTP